MKEAYERKPDYDLQSCIEYNSPGILTSEIRGIWACVPGEAEGPSWFWILELNDGRKGLLYGGCDYTGWD